MLIGVPAEITAGETRVAITPETAKKLKSQGHTIRIQDGTNPVEVIQRGLTLELDELWGRLDQGLHRRIFGIQNAQRIQVQTPTRIFIQLIDVLLKVGDERRTVQLTFLGLTQAVQLESHILEP